MSITNDFYKGLRLALETKNKLSYIKESYLSGGGTLGAKNCFYYIIK